MGCFLGACLDFTSQRSLENLQDLTTGDHIKREKKDGAYSNQHSILVAHMPFCTVPEKSTQSVALLICKAKPVAPSGQVA